MSAWTTVNTTTGVQLFCQLSYPSRIVYRCSINLHHYPPTSVDLQLFFYLISRHGRSVGSSSAVAAWAVTQMSWSTTRTTTRKSPSGSSTCTAASRWMPAWPLRGRSSRTASFLTLRLPIGPFILLLRLRRRWTSGSAPSASCVALTRQTTLTVTSPVPYLSSVFRVSCFW